MEKLLVVLNGMHIPMHVLQFAMDTAKKNKYCIEALFLHEEQSHDLGYPFPNDLALTAETVTSETLAEEQEKLLADNIQFVEHECSIVNVPCTIQQRVTLRELVQISASADLLLVDTKAVFQNFELNDLFTDVECPVCSVAATAAKPRHIVFAFDGSEGSKYAIRKFADLFPDLPEADMHLVSVDTDNNKHGEFINDWLTPRYKSLSTHLLSGNEKEALVDFLRQYPDDALVVMGAFGRSALSRLFHPSLATAVLNNTRLSLFLAHE